MGVRLQKIREAAALATYRAVRTFFQTLAGSMLAVPVATSILDVRNQALAIGLALWIATFGAVMAFAQNFSEGLKDE